MSGNVQAVTSPTNWDELFARDFLGHHDFGQERHAHAERRAMLDGFDAGKFRQVAGADIHDRQKLIEFFTVSAARFRKQKSLSDQVMRFDFFRCGKWMRSICDEQDFFRTQTQ